MPALQPSVSIGLSQVKELLSEALRTFPLETGGILMGFESGWQLVVTAVIGPGPGAVHRRRSFIPDAEWQSARVAEVYAQSGRTEQYLGDWHTHPRGSTRASLTDYFAARTIARHAPARCPRPLMLILGVAGVDGFDLAAYRWRRGVLRSATVVTGG